MPSVRSVGVGASGVGDITPVFGAHVAGDLAVLLAECDTATVPTPAGGWVLAPNMPVVINGCALYMWTLECASGAEPNPTITDPGNHVHGTIIVFQDADTTIHAFATAENLGAPTAFTTPGFRTLLDDCYVVAAAAYIIDNAGPIAAAWANASLANVAELYDAGTIDGNGGGLIVAAGQKAAAGTVSPTTATITASSTSAIHFALAPKRAVAIGGDVEIDGDPAPDGANVVTILDVTQGDARVSASIAGGAFTALVRYDDHSYIAVYDDGTERGASSAQAAGASTHDIVIGGAGGAAPTEPVAATATTATAIREELATAIGNLTPTSQPLRGFERYEKSLAYRKAMTQSPGNSFRRFACWFDKESKVPITRNGTNQRWRYKFHVEVAYPEVHSGTADVPRLELDQHEDEDQRLIQDAIWNIENATWIKSGSPEPTSETVDGVTFVHYVAEFEFIRAMP